MEDKYSHYQSYPSLLSNLPQQSKLPQFTVVIKDECFGIILVFVKKRPDFVTVHTPPRTGLTILDMIFDKIVHEDFRCILCCCKVDVADAAEIQVDHDNLVS